MSLGIIGSVITNRLAQLNEVIMSEASRGIEFAVSLAGIMALWMGVMNIAKDSGLISKIGDILSPVLKKLFPSIPKGHKAMSYIVMNMVLNMLGAGNGATAFGLKAMNELQKENKNKDELSDNMMMLIVLNTASLQIIPTTVIALRSSLGSNNPTQIIFPVWVSTICAAIVGIILTKIIIRYTRK